ncbi:MAG: DUF2393 family protein [Acidobacteria bacterium]|nr:DUF2393 family protein [Acidobacteriota bacterium]
MSDFSNRPENVERPSEQGGTPVEFKAPVFSPQEAEKGPGMPLSAWVIAGAVVLVVLAGIVFAGRRKSPEIKGIQPPAAYASSLPLSNLEMSESTSLSGGKSTFIDGRIRNTGTSTVTGIIVQVLFRNEEQMPPQIETLPLTLIRTREPYVDTQPVSAAPLRSGDEREFRLIFESIPANWNMQMPEIHIVKVDTK